MTKKLNFLLFGCFILLYGCNTSSKKSITDKGIYNSYLASTKNTSKTFYESEFNFWNEKLQKHSNQYPYLAKMASANSGLFDATGDITYLIEAEKNLLQLNQHTKYKKAGYLRSLARNYISQHRFKASLSLLEKAEEIGEDLKATQKMLFDVHIELGHDDLAKNYLDGIKNFRDFDYLIRLSKWSDHKGDLASAIKYMEQGTAIAESSNIKGLMQWSYTNLADFYGHDGQIQKSYDYFMKALEIEPEDAYAKKGIAWIVYSHERNPEEALRILNTITKNYKAPDYFLLKAEIAEYMNLDIEKANNLKKYFVAVSNDKYGVMYDAYNVILFAEDTKQLDDAVKLAKSEVSHRATPQSYDLLAWAYFNKGNKEKALKIIENHVVNQTFEPNALFHIAQIYKANGKLDKALELKKALLGCIYELGPIMEKNIKLI